MKREKLLGVGVILLVAALLGGSYAVRRDSGRVDFTLNSADGMVSLRDFRGKGVVVYFGFTSCPYICPTAMARLSKLLPQLPAELRSEIIPVFVSVDYKSDTPARVGTYIQQFFPQSGKGLTGNKEQLDHAAAELGAAYSLEINKEAPLGYVVNHPDRYYLLDPQGRLVQTVQLESSNEVILNALKKI